MAQINLKDFELDIDKSARAAFNGILGKRCCRQRAGEYRSLTLGFGEKIPHARKKSVDHFNGEWELGTYSSAWRITRNEEILCGSMNPVDSNAELEQQVSSIQIGALVSIEMLSKFDIRLTLEDGMCIDFMCASSDDENMFHIFGPNHLFVGYKCIDGWNVGKSNEPTAANRG